MAQAISASKPTSLLTKQKINLSTGFMVLISVVTSLTILGSFGYLAGNAAVTLVDQKYVVQVNPVESFGADTVRPGDTDVRMAVIDFTKVFRKQDISMVLNKIKFRTRSKDNFNTSGIEFVLRDINYNIVGTAHPE